MKDYILGFIVAIVSFLLGLTICWNENIPESNNYRIFSMLLTQLEQKNINKKYDAARSLFYLRRQVQSFASKLIPILLESKDPLVKSLLLDTIANSDYHGKKLFTFLNDSHEDVRAAAILAVKSHKKALPKILHMARHDVSYFVRKTAVSCFLELSLSKQKSVRYLLKSLNDDEDEVRMMAAKLLGKIQIKHFKNRQKISNALMAHILNEPGEMRYIAMESLGSYPEVLVVHFICKFLKFSDMRPHCIKALAKISILQKNTLETLNQYTTKYNAIIKNILEVILVEGKNGELLFLMKYLEFDKINPKVIQTFLLQKKNAVSLLLKAFQSNNSQIKKRVLRILGELKEKNIKVQNIFLKELQKKNTSKYELIVALSKIGYFETK